MAVSWLRVQQGSLTERAEVQLVLQGVPASSSCAEGGELELRWGSPASQAWGEAALVHSASPGQSTLELLRVCCAQTSNSFSEPSP